LQKAAYRRNGRPASPIRDAVTRGVSPCSAKLTRRDHDLISIGAPVSIQYCDLSIERDSSPGRR